MASRPYDPFSLPGEIRASENSYFCQAARQLASVPSSQLCVKLASGGDPTYAFNIRFTGEEVHGTSKWLLDWVQMHRPWAGDGSGAQNDDTLLSRRNVTVRSIAQSCHPSHQGTEAGTL